MAYTLVTMSRIWTKEISKDISARISASKNETGKKFAIEKITLVSEAGGIRIELSLYERDIKGLIALIKEGENGTVKFL